MVFKAVAKQGRQSDRQTDKRKKMSIFYQNIFLWIFVYVLLVYVQRCALDAFLLLFFHNFSSN